MVTLGGLAILTWLALDASVEFGNSTQVQDPVIAQTNERKIKSSDLYSMREGRNKLYQFLEAAVMAGLAGEDFGPYASMVAQQQVQQLVGGIDDESLVNSILLTDEAKRIGVVVSDESITEFLKRVTRDRVSGEQLTAMCRQVGANRATIFELLRSLLMARRAESMLASRPIATPAERWDYFLRLRERATAEITPVAVSDFISQVADPGDSVLRAFFDKYKNTEPLPGASEPGFKAPAKAAVQYFVADYAKFFDEAAVTEQEIEDYYEKNKDTLFLYTDVGSSLDAFPPLSDLGASLETNSAGDVAADLNDPIVAPPATPLGSPAATPESATEGASPATEDAPPGGLGANGETRHDAILSYAENHSSGPLSILAQNDAVVEPSTTGGAAESPSAGETSEETAEPTESDTALDSPPATEPAASSPDAAPSEETSSAPSLGQPNGDPFDATTPPTVPATDAAAPPTAPPPIGRSLMLPEGINAGENPKYDPLWKVSDRIRRTLAGEKAIAKMTEALNGLQMRMQDFGRERANWNYNRERGAGEDAVPPKPLDFDALAKETGVSSGVIPLSSRFELRGESGIVSATVEGRPFADYLFDSDQVFITARAEDSPGNRYLFWKNELTEAFLPELADVKDEVIRAWKTIEARALARKAADELVAQATAAGKSLKDLFAGDANRPVIETGAFAWLTTGTAGAFNQQVPPELSEIPGVQDIGDDFMRAVFSLSVDEVGVAPNAPETVYYVVRVTSLTPDRDLLHALFMAEPFQQYASSWQLSQQKLYDDWLADLQKRAGLKWDVPPSTLASN